MTVPGATVMPVLAANTTSCACPWRAIVDEQHDLLP